MIKKINYYLNHYNIIIVTVLQHVHSYAFFKAYNIHTILLQPLQKLLDLVTYFIFWSWHIKVSCQVNSKLLLLL